MQVQYERDENGLTTLTVEIPVETVDEVYQKALREFKRHVTVPGFRRGKVPPKMIESIIGPEHIAEHARELLTDQVLPDAFRQVPELVSLGEPELDLGGFKRGEPCAMTAKMVCAKVELAEYKGMAVEQYRGEATLEEAQSEIDERYTRGAERFRVEHEEAREGDEVEFALRIVQDGVLIEDYDDADPLRVRIGQNALNPNIDEHLLGCRVGEYKVVEVTYPDDYGNEELRGKTAEFAIRVVGLVQPEPKPEFLKRSMGLEDEAEAVEHVRKLIADHRMATYRIVAREAAVQQLVTNSTLDIPSSHIEADVMEETDEFEEELEARNIDLDALDEELEAEYDRIRQRVTYDIQRSVVLRAVAQIEEIAVEQDDMIRELSMMSNANRVDPRLMMRRLEEQGQLPEVMRNARLRKTADLIYSWAAITEVDPPEDDEDEVDATAARAVEPIIGELEDEAEPVALSEEPEDEPCP